MHRILYILFLIILTGCTSTVKNVYNTIKPPQARTESELFQVGESALAHGYYDVAIKHFEMISSKYPYSKFSEQAQLNLIYAYQNAGDNDAAIKVAERFVRFYPRSKYVDYAYYMRAVAYFEQDRGMLFNYFPLDPAERDLHEVRKSFEQFASFLRRFPQSDYVGDARQRMIFVRNLLAQHELNVAKLYMEDKRYLATANRLNTLIKDYPEAPQTEQALDLLVEANLALGLKKPAEQAYRVLEANFPNSSYIKQRRLA